MVDLGWCLDCREYGQLFLWVSKKTKHEYWICKKCHESILKYEDES